MKFENFMMELFANAFPANKSAKPLQKGRPINISPYGAHARHPGVIIKNSIRQHATKEGKLCFQAVIGGKRPPMPMMVHKGIPYSVMKAMNNTAKRKASGRYVW